MLVSSLCDREKSCSCWVQLIKYTRQTVINRDSKNTGKNCIDKNGENTEERKHRDNQSDKILIKELKGPNISFYLQKVILRHQCLVVCYNSLVIAGYI